VSFNQQFVAPGYPGVIMQGFYGQALVLGQPGLFLLVIPDGQGGQPGIEIVIELFFRKVVDGCGKP